MRAFIIGCLVYLFSISSSAQFSAPTEHVNWATGFRYNEIVVSVNVPLTKCFFGCSGREVTLRGKLLIPTTEGTTPYKLFVSNHGSQFRGGSHFKTRANELQKDSITGLLLQNGYAIFFPYRKGFSADELPRSDASADTYETTSCDADMKIGLESAVSDVKAFLKMLSTRNDLDMKNIIVSGQSRGAVVALALAAEGYPGIVGVVNRSGGWMGEVSSAGTHCSAVTYNFDFFKSFGEKTRVPILSLYGGKDPFYGLPHIKTLLSYLGKHAPSDYVIVEDAGHGVYMSSEFIIKLEKFLQMTTGTKDNLK